MKRYVFLLCVIIQSTDCSLLDCFRNQFNHDSNPVVDIATLSEDPEHLPDRVWRRIKENGLKTFTAVAAITLVVLVAKLSPHHIEPIAPIPDPDPTPDCTPNNGSLTNHANFDACMRPWMWCLPANQTVGTKCHQYYACLQTSWFEPKVIRSELFSTASDTLTGDLDQEIMIKLSNISSDISVGLCTFGPLLPYDRKCPGIDINSFVKDIVHMARALESVKPACKKPKQFDLHKKLEDARLRAKKSDTTSVQRNQNNMNNFHAMKRSNNGRKH